MRKTTLLFFLLFCETLAAQWHSAPGIIPYRKGTLWGFCDPSKKTIVPSVYSEVDVLNHHLLIGEKPDGTRDLYDHSGKKLFSFSDMRDFEKGYALVRQDQLNGLIDSTGRMIIPVQYGYEISVSEGMIICERSCPARTDCGCDVYDTSGTKLFTLDSVFVYPYYQGRAWIRSTTRQGTVDRKGHVKWLPESKYYNFRPARQFIIFARPDSMGGSGMSELRGKNDHPAARLLVDRVDVFQPDPRAERGEPLPAF